MNEREIFEKALELTDLDVRAAFLDGACNSDEEIRGRIEALLRSHEQAGSFLKGPAKAITPTMDLAPSIALGTNVGPYKLLQQLGEGGMGEVYLAEQTEPVQRRVAVKIIKAGMDTRQVLARFEAERQALAMMDHPNIAKVFDAGTTDVGKPYFVMELVKGVPITRYCDEHQLDPRQRLELFQDVCHAVQHAHQKGLIHRDIKPSNVMVAEYDDRAVPKVIDFGVAKATQQRLTEKTMFTEIGTVLGTIEYMSPEQAKLNQLDIDTRSDIYSLGVLLYELLTGETPFDRKMLRSAALDEMLRIIREQEPSRPSIKLGMSESLPSVAANRKIDSKRLSVLVRGELDWIVMKALEKDRTRRYDTANAFSDDIANYLNDDPVAACPPSAGYRLRKFARRNSAVVATVASVIFVLTAGMIATASQTRWAIAERDRAVTAEKRAKHAEKVAEDRLADVVNARGRTRAALDEMSSRLVRDWLESQEKLTDDQKEYVQKSIKLYEEFASESGDDLEVIQQIAAARLRLGDLQLLLGLNSDAEQTFARATSVLRSVTASNRDSRKLRLLLAKSLRCQDEFAEAEAILEDHLGAHPGDDEYRRTLVGCYSDHAGQLSTERDKRLALELNEKAEKHQRELLANKSPELNSDDRRRLAVILGNKASNLVGLGENALADEERDKAIDVLEKLAEQFPSDSQISKHLVVLRLNRAIRLTDRNKYAEAEDEYRHLQKLQLSLARSHPSNPAYRQRLGQIQINFCRLLIKSKQLEKAEEVAREAIAGWEYLTDNFEDPSYQTGLGASQTELASIYGEREQYDTAISTVTQALETLEEARQTLGLTKWVHYDLLIAYRYRADWRMKLRRYAEAANDYKEILQLDDSAGNRHRMAVALCRSDQLAKYRECCVELIEQHGQTDDPKIARSLTQTLLYGPRAVDDWTLPVKLSQLLLSSGSGKHEVKSHVSELLCRAGEYDRSLELRAEAIAEAGREPDGWDCFWQAMAHHGLGNIDQARELASKSRELADSHRLGANNHDVFEMMFIELTGKLNQLAEPLSKEDATERP